MTVTERSIANNSITITAETTPMAMFTEALSVKRQDIYHDYFSVDNYFINDKSVQNNYYFFSYYTAYMAFE